MSKKFLVAIDLAKNELQNGVVHNLAAAPSSPVKGQLYYNTADNVLYWWDGTTWIPAKDAGAGPPAVPVTRLINTTAPLTGGGDLSADRTLAVSTFTSGASGVVPASGGGTTNFLRADGTWATAGMDQATADARYVNVTGDTMSGPLDMGNQKITSLAQPTAASDAANKSYVDNLSTGLAWKDTVRAATTANITLSGTQTIDGVALVAGNRVLVKNQTTASANGIYDVAAGAWTRATDADSEAELLDAAVFVSEGTVNADTAWVMTANAPITVGSTNITWVQFAGAGTITAGAGLTQTGNTLDVGAGTGITVAADTVSFDTTFGDGRYALAASAAKRFAANVGGATSQAISHNLGTRDVVVNVYRSATPWDTVECDIERTDTNTVTLRFTVAPAAAEFRCVVIA